MIHTLVLSLQVDTHDLRFLKFQKYFLDLRNDGTQIPGVTAEVRVKTPNSASRNLAGLYFNFFIDALLLTGKFNLDTPKDYDLIANIVDKLLAPVNLTIHDLRVYRIDYCWNVRIQDPSYRELLMHLWSKCDLSGGRLRVSKYSTAHPKEDVGQNDAYFHNSKRTVQIYDKEAERTDKGKLILPHEAGVIRLEYQTFFDEIKATGDCRYETWANDRRASAQLANAAELFFTGDFYSIRAADLRLEKAGLSPLMCAKLHDYMVSVSNNGVRRAAKFYKADGKKALITDKTAQSYRQILGQHGICPVPIPKSYGVSHIENPFQKILTGGAAA